MPGSSQASHPHCLTGAHDLGGHHLTTHRLTATHGWTTSFLGAPTTRAHAPAPRTGRRLPARGSIRSARLVRRDRSARGLCNPDRLAHILRSARSDCLRDSVRLVRQAGQVGRPFDWEQILLRRVARAARGHEVRTDGTPASNQRDAVVHRELTRGRGVPAVAASLPAKPALPPRARPKLARARLLPAELVPGDRAHEAARRRRQRVRIRARRSDGW